MPLRSLAKYIKNRRKKEKTFEEKLKMVQLICSMANEMKLVLNSVNTNLKLFNEMLKRAEPHVFEDKQTLTFNSLEYEALYEMLNSLNIISVQGTKTVDHILLLLEDID